VTYLVCAYFTAGTGYASEADELLKTIEQFDLPCRIDCVPNLGSWEANTYHKVEFVASCLDDQPADVLYVDSDARFRQRPVLFDDAFAADFAAHIRSGTQLLSGTLYFANNAVVRELLKKWRETNDQQRKHGSVRFEQDNLRSAFLAMKHRLAFCNLPASYCQIFDIMQGEGGDPVIEHMQASRRLRKTIT
jgi:hypothetical protein